MSWFPLLLFCKQYSNHLFSNSSHFVICFIVYTDNMYTFYSSPSICSLKFIFTNHTIRFIFLVCWDEFIYFWTFKVVLLLFLIYVSCYLLVHPATPFNVSLIHMLLHSMFHFIIICSPCFFIQLFFMQLFTSVYIWWWSWLLRAPDLPLPWVGTCDDSYVGSRASSLSMYDLPWVGTCDDSYVGFRAL